MLPGDGCVQSQVSFLSLFTEGLNQHVRVQTNPSPWARRSLPGHRRAAEPISSGVGAACFLLELLMPWVQKTSTSVSRCSCPRADHSGGFLEGWKPPKARRRLGRGLPAWLKPPALLWAPPPYRYPSPASETRTSRFEFSIQCDLPAALPLNERKKEKRKDDLWRD